MKAKIIISAFLGYWILAISGNGSTFDVRSYGAYPNDSQEDTVAIQKAIEAARAVGGGTVYFPTGTYTVSPPGKAVVSLYRKSGGVWESLGSNLQTGQILSNWLITDVDPVVSAGVTAAINIRNGTVFSLVGEEWRPNGSLLDGSGSGWYAGFDAPASSLGADGAYYLRHYEVFDHLNGAVFELLPAHSNIRFVGDGPGKSILSFKVWSGKDPMDYEVDTVQRTIIRAAIPRNSSGRYMRGSLFVLKQEGTGNFRNIEWDGLELRGNTIASGKDSWYTPYDDLEEWDISNKGIVFSFGALPMYGIGVRNVSIHGWRGEILYKGGSGYADITIENCDIYETNSSAVSISGSLVMRDCRIWNTYNGVENYCDADQFSEIYNCEIDLDRSFRGHFGVVYLGTTDAHLVVENSTINGAINGAVFLSDFAHNVRVSGNSILNCEWGVYMMYMNLYGLPGAFNNLVVENNIFTAEKYRFGHVVMNAAVGIPEKDWILRDNTVVSAGSPAWFFFRSDNTIGRAEHNVVLSGNTVPETTLFRGTGVVPEFAGNVSKVVELNTWTATSGVYPFSPDNPEFVITNLAVDGLRLSINDLQRYPVGHQFTVRVMHPDTSRSLLLEPANWNTLSSPIRLYRGEERTFVLNAERLFELVGFVVVQPEPEPPIAPELTASPASESTISLAWATPDNVDGYTIEMAHGGGSYSHLLTVGTDIESFLVEDLDWREDYQFRICALRDGLYSTWTETDWVSPDDPPLLAPEGLSSITVGVGQIGIQWNSVLWAEAYELQLAVEGMEYASEAILSADTNLWTSGLLDVEAVYAVRLRTLRNGQASEWAQMGGLVPGQPEAPEPPTEPEVPQLPDPVHAWYFDEEAIPGWDSGWGLLHLNIGDFPLEDGIAGSALVLSGNHSGVLIPDTATLNRDTQETLTIAMWIFPDADSTQSTSLVYEQGGYWRGLNVILEKGSILAGGWNKPEKESGWEETLLLSEPIEAGQWNHVAVVLNGGPTVTPDAFQLFVNGRFVSSGPGSRIWKQNDNNGIGQVQQSTVYRGRQVRGLDPFHGKLDGVVVFHDAFNEEQIQTLILLDFPDSMD
jgi:hypothetical protein